MFQSVYTNREQKGLGDTDLKEFVGSAEWFSNPENIRSLMASNANAELKALAVRLELQKRIEEGYVVRQVFVTTRATDDNGRQYLGALEKTARRLEVWDRPLLIGVQQSLSRKTRVPGTHRFTGVLQQFQYASEPGVRVLIAPVKASDIARMNGIEDRSLFSLNVRSGLGRTRVNRDLEKAIQEGVRHSQFVLFHNGLTITCKRFRSSATAREISITDYSVVNGCQSAIAFHDNRSVLTEKLRIITRIIEVGDNDQLAEDITFRSNNQNGINLRDLKSNDRVQTALQKQFRTRFGGSVEYAIKAGDEQPAAEVIRNDRAGQWLMALYLCEPYNAHQKYKIFGPDYERIFGRDVTAERIYLCSLASAAVDSASSAIEDEAIRGYQLTKLILMGAVGTACEATRLGDPCWIIRRVTSRDRAMQ